MRQLTKENRAITRDEATYPDAETFNPRRWLDPAFPTYRAPLTQYPNLNGYSQFGFGRRTCQGVPIVEQDLFLTMGGMAWAFDVRKRRDPVTGHEVPVHWNDYTPLLIAKPTPFPFDAVPRSEAKIARIREMHEAAEAREAANRELENGYEFVKHQPEAAPDSAAEVDKAGDEEMHRVEQHDTESEQGVSISVRDSSSSEPALSSRGSGSEADEPMWEADVDEMEMLKGLIGLIKQKHVDTWKPEGAATAPQLPGT